MSMRTHDEVTTETFATFVKSKYRNMKAKPTIMKDETVVATRLGVKWVSSTKAVIGSHAAPDAVPRKRFANYLVQSTAMPVAEDDEASAASAADEASAEASEAEEADE
jgi:hypothetical protein